MPKHEIKFLRKAEVAAGTASFFFEKPDGFSFKPGQNADYTLIDPPETDKEGDTRTFSFVSAPHEPEIEIAMRMRDTAFKRSLGNMEPGTKILMEGPMGSMTLQNDASRPAVFIAGGIGITPFVSMLRRAAEEKLPHRIWLFYSNRTPGDAAFLRELTDLQNENRNYSLVATMTQSNDERWDGEMGYIDEAMLRRHIARDNGGADSMNSPIYYLAGPPAMTTSMRGMLNAAGIDDDDIKSEEFSGY